MHDPYSMEGCEELSDCEMVSVEIEVSTCAVESPVFAELPLKFQGVEARVGACHFVFLVTLLIIINTL